MDGLTERMTERSQEVLKEGRSDRREIMDRQKEGDEWKERRMEKLIHLITNLLKNERMERETNGKRGGRTDGRAKHICGSVYVSTTVSWSHVTPFFCIITQ